MMDVFASVLNRQQEQISRLSNQNDILMGMVVCIGAITLCTIGVGMWLVWQMDKKGVL